MTHSSVGFAFCLCYMLSFWLPSFFLPFYLSFFLPSFLSCFPECCDAMKRHRDIVISQLPCAADMKIRAG